MFITKVSSAFEDNKITSRILDRVTETLESVGGYRPHRNHQNPFLPPESAFPPFSPSRVSHSSDTIPFSPSPPSFSPLELLDGGSGDAGNVSFVRGPVSAGSSNHLFPSSLGYIWLCAPTRSASAPRVLTRNPFSQYAPPSSRAVPFLSLSLRLPSRLPSRSTTLDRVTPFFRPAYRTVGRLSHSK